MSLAERQLSVERPRLRRKGQGRGGEVEIPAYQVLRENPAMGQRMFGALLRGVSTRRYRDILPQMAETVGISKSAVSQQAIEASSAQLEELLARRRDDVELLVIYIDGMRFGEHHVISAVGVEFSEDSEANGKKHVLGLQAGVTENTAAVRSLLVHLRDHGLSTEKRYLFVIDGAKALRAAIDEVFGANQAVSVAAITRSRTCCRNFPRSNTRRCVP